MRAGTGRRRTAVVALAAAAALVTGGAVTATPSQAAPAAGTGTPVTVMTRNLYLGGDITRPLDATARPDRAPGAAGLRAVEPRAGRRSSTRPTSRRAPRRWPARSRASDPDLVGLQEVALWRHGTCSSARSACRTPRRSTTTSCDPARRARGARVPTTAVAEVQEESDVEGPAFAACPADGTGRDVRLTMRDGSSRDGGVKVEDSDSGAVRTRIPFSIAGVPFTFIRG